MKATDVYRLMKHPEQLTEETLQELKLIIEEFPCFQIAHLLYLKNLVVLNDIRFGAELKKKAIFIPDRRKLFMMIEGERYGLHLLLLKDAGLSESESGTFSLIDAFLTTYEQQKEKVDPLLFQPSVSADYLHWYLMKVDENQDEKKKTSLQHQDLIDSFIEKEKQHKGEKIGTVDVADQTVPKVEMELHKPLDDSYFTETLAHIYVKQKRYERALLIIKKLSLKNPEKNAYFADQIRFLEKLIINTKK